MPWELSGNSDVTITSFLGPTNTQAPQPLVIKTTPSTAGAAPLERLRVTTEGRVGIGIINPSAKLTVAGGGALINNVAIGTDGLSGLDYPNEQDTIGLANPYPRPSAPPALLRLQSPNGLAFHTGAPGASAADNLRMTITPGGEVGVGKAPGANYKLDVAGTVNATDYHKNGSALMSSQWADVSGGINYAGGNVGIGIANPSTKLDVAGDVAIRGSAVVGVGGWGRLKIRHIDGKHFENDDDDGLFLNRATRQPVLIGYTDATADLLVSGDVGIGTLTPENSEEWNRVLDVLGADAGGTKLSVRTESVDAQVWAAAGEWWGAPAGMAVGTKSAHALSFATGGSSRMTIDPSGEVEIRENVGIGRNLNVAGQLRWGNSVANPDSLELGPLPNGTGTPFIDFHFKNLEQDYNTRIINDENGRLSIVGNLNVIGDVTSRVFTTAPGTLQVQPQGGPTEGGEITLLGAGSNGHTTIDNYGGSFRVITQGAERLRVSSNGDVGINRNLNVAGNIRFSDGSVQTTAYRLFIQSGAASPGALNTPQKPTQEQGVWVPFPVPFAAAPSVVLALKTLDTDHSFNQRIDVWPINITAQGFTAYFRTWSDTRIYLVSANWIAYGSR